MCSLHLSERPFRPDHPLQLWEQQVPGGNPSGILSAATSIAVRRSVPAFLPYKGSVDPRSFGDGREPRRHPDSRVKK